MRLAFLRHYGLPEEIIVYIESFISEEEKAELSKHISRLINEANVENLRLLYTLEIKLDKKEDQDKLNQFFVNAVKKKNLHVAKLLLSIGADVEALGKPFDLCVGANSYGRISARCKDGSHRTLLEYKPVHIAIENRQIAMVKLLLANNADVTVPVLGLPYNQVVSGLFECGQSEAFKQAQDTGNWREIYKHALRPCINPLHLSLEANDTEMTQLLIESGADIHSPTDFIQKPTDCYGRAVINPTPIYLAAQKKNREIVRIFLEKGCYHTPRGCFIESTLYDGDFFIAFVEQEIEKKQREEMLKQHKQVIDLLTKQTELLTDTNRKIKKLSRRVKRLKLVKNTEETEFASTVVTSKTQNQNTPKSVVADQTSFFRQSQPQSAQLPTELQQLGLIRYIKAKCGEITTLSFDGLLLPKIKKPEDLSAHDEVHLLENFKQQMNKIEKEYFERVDALSQHLPPPILSLFKSLKSQLNAVLQLAIEYTDNISENYNERFHRYSVIQTKLEAIFKCVKRITTHIKILDIEAILNKNVSAEFNP